LTLVSYSFHVPSSSQIYSLSLHDALPIFQIISMSSQELLVRSCTGGNWLTARIAGVVNKKSRPPLKARFCQLTNGHSNYTRSRRSEEHTSELQSRENLVCRLLLEKKKKKT